MPLARSIARRYAVSGEPFEDLEQTAYVGLVAAVDRFDPARGTPFTGFAVPTILGELRRHFRDHTWAVHVPRGLQELSLRLERETDALAAELGRMPTARELAECEGMSVEAVMEGLEASAAYNADALTIERDDDGDGHVAPGDYDNGLVRAEDRAALAPLLAGLKPHERTVVLLRFHWDLTQHQIGQLVGVSQMGVSRILRRSLERMHHVAAEDGDACRSEWS